MGTHNMQYWLDHGGVFCDLCGAGVRKRNLQKHMRNVHGITNASSIAEQDCNKSTLSSGSNGEGDTEVNTGEGIEDLWGDLDESPNVTAPSRILKEQCRLLQKKLNKVISELQKHENRTSGDRMIVRTMVVRAASDAKLKTKLITIAFDLSYYPVEIVDHVHETNHKATDEDEFKRIIAKIFRSSKTRNIVNRLHNSETL